MAREVRVAILGDSRDFSRAVRDARGDADRLDDSFSRVGHGAARMGRAVGLAVAGGVVAAGSLAVSFIRAAEDSQRVSRQTQAVLTSMGNGANVTARHVSNLANRLSLLAGVDDELIQSGQNILLTFGQVRNGIGEGNNVFDRATRAALDLSVALGTDMSTAAMQVGRALNDPIRGLAALRRSGIQFTEQQEEQIRTMVRVGDVAGAQRVMLEELERQFGGSAEAQATASARIAVAWDNIKEQIGTALLPAFEAAAVWLTERLPGAMAWAGERIDDLKAAWERLTTAIFGTEDWDSFWSDVEAGWVDAQSRWDDFTKDLRAGWEEFTSRVFGNEDWDSFWADVGRGWDVVKEKWNNFTEDLAAGWRKAVSEIDQLTEPFISSLNAIWDAAWKLGDAFDYVFGSLSDVLNLGSSDWWNVVPKRLGELTPRTTRPTSGPHHSGGIVSGPVGSDQLALVQAGEGVFTREQMAALGVGAGGGGQSINLTVQLDGQTLLSSLLKVERTSGPLPITVTAVA